MPPTSLRRRRRLRDLRAHRHLSEDEGPRSLLRTLGRGRRRPASARRGFRHATRRSALARQGDDGRVLHRSDLWHGQRRRAYRRQRGSTTAGPGSSPHARSIAPAEELIWHRLFISERHRHDMSDIVHSDPRATASRSIGIGWSTASARHWPLLLSQMLMFHYVYPGYRTNVPTWVPGAAARTGACPGRPTARTSPIHERSV